MDLNEHHNMITSLKNLQNISRDDSRTGNDSCIDNAYKTRNKATRVEQHMGLYQHRKISATIHTCRNFFFSFYASNRQHLVNTSDTGIYLAQQELKKDGLNFCYLRAFYTQDCLSSRRCIFQGMISCLPLYNKWGRGHNGARVCGEEMNNWTLC